MIFENDDKINREYKDSLFTDIFSDKGNALSLYNAIQGTAYTDIEDVEIIVLKNSFFITYRNDASIFFDSRITMWEHQSTLNFNMPIRGLIYYARAVDGYLEKKGLKRKIYRKTLVKIPAPDYYVLYNGTEDAPDRQELKLSDAFMTPSPGYEWTAKFININAGHNRELMDACPALKGYATLVGYMRDGVERGMDDESAADAAIAQCIDENYLREYLLQKRGEAKLMLLRFDENDLEMSLKEEREEGRQEGREEGRQEGRQEGQQLILDIENRLLSGETQDALIADGVDPGTVNAAAKFIEAVVAMA